MVRSLTVNEEIVQCVPKSLPQNHLAIVLQQMILILFLWFILQGICKEFHLTKYQTDPMKRPLTIEQKTKVVKFCCEDKATVKTESNNNINGNSLSCTKQNKNKMDDYKEG